MGRIYDYAKKLQEEGVYNEREVMAFAPPGIAKDGSCIFQEAGMAKEQVDEVIKMMMQERKMRIERKNGEYDTESF